MVSNLITLIDDDFKEILEIMDIWDIDKYMKRFNTCLKCSNKLKKLLYEETDCCLEIFNNFIKDVITNYVNHKIKYDELESCLQWKFECKNTIKKEKFNDIFPEFIQLIIDNIEILNKERDEIIVVKPKTPYKYLPDTDFEDDSVEDMESDEEIEVDMEEETETNDLELIDYDTKREPFDFRDNQKDAINNTIAQDFKSGIHCQIMGAGKTFIMLNIIYQHWLKYQQNLTYIIATDKIEILKSWFMINILDKLKSDYVKSKNIIKVDIGTFKTEEYLEYEVRKLKNTKYYKVKDGNTTYTFNYDRFIKWTEDEIIDMNDFDISENIIDKTTFNFDKPLDRPVIYIVNNAFLKAGNKYKKLNYDNIGLVLVDECHSVSGKQNYEMLEYIRNKGINIQGFSATPLRPVKNASDQLLKVYGDKPNEETNELNIISNYDMIKALKDGVILPFVHTIISPITDKKSLKIKSNNKQELTLQKIIENYFINNSDLPYKKGVAWVNSISKIAKDEGVYYKEIKAICGNKINLFVSYSGNKVYSEINELSEFEKCTSNALLLCVNRVKEGSDIKNLDCGLFLDAVKSRSIVSSLQSIGRIMRPDDKKKKKFAHIIESIKLDELKTVESITVSKVLNYYKKILNIASLSQQSAGYIDEILRLFDETEIINDDGQKAINIVIDKQKDIKCRINLNIKQIDWRIFQDALREKLSDKLKIDEDEILKREFVKLKYAVKKLKLVSKDEYKKYARDNKLEESPEVKYKNWWKNWYDFLGIDVSRYPKNKEDLIKICKNAKIEDLKGYYKFAEDLNLPLMLEELYVNFGILENELNKDFNRRRK
jgi:superfamily II DNA or RNA helicase